MKSEDKSIFDALNDSESAILTIWGEARGEPFIGQQAVAQVIANRADRWHMTVKQVCYQPNAFSCYLGFDPNYANMLKVVEILREDKAHDWSQGILSCADAWEQARPEVAAQIDNATFYLVTGTKNGWFDREIAAGKLMKTAEIGAHSFYKEV